MIFEENEAVFACLVFISAFLFARQIDLSTVHHTFQARELPLYFPSDQQAKEASSKGVTKFDRPDDDPFKKKGPPPEFTTAYKKQGPPPQFTTEAWGGGGGAGGSPKGPPPSKFETVMLFLRNRAELLISEGWTQNLVSL